MKCYQVSDFPKAMIGATLLAVSPCVRLDVASKNLNNLKRDNNGTIAFTGVSRTSAG